MHRVRHRFAAVNMSGPRVRQMFVFLLLGTAIIFIFTGFFAMMRAKVSSRSSDLGRFTAGLSAETMVGVLAREIPYLKSSVSIPQKDGVVSRLTFELATSVDPRDPRTFLGRELPGFALFEDRKSTRLNSSHVKISYAVFCLQKKISIGQHRDRILCAA